MTPEERIPDIKVPPPGPKAQELIKRDSAIISPSFARYLPLVVDKLEGCIVTDVDGNKYIDFNSGLVTMIIGQHPEVVEAIKKQADNLIHYSYTDFYYKQFIEMGETLTRITPGDFSKKVFFGNSGAEANEAAIKVVRWHTRRPRLLAYIKGFHGRTYGAMSLTASKTVQRRYFFPLVPGVSHIPYPNCYRCPFHLEYPQCSYWCVDYIDEYVLGTYAPAEEVAAIIIEPIQGEGGYAVPPADYFKRLQKILRQHKILLISDEIQSGMGRTGKWCAIEHYDVVPDVITLAKAVGGGIPLGAMICRSEIQNWEAGSHASTFGGNPVACTAGLKTIQIIERDGLLQNASELGEYIMTRFKEMQQKYQIIGDVRGKGLMIGVELVENRKTKKPAKKATEDLIMNVWKKGVALISAGLSTLRIAPSLVISQDLVDIALPIIEEEIATVNKRMH
jgi:4-aminobutyrate aminotransferase